ncbi:MAG: hypothetical protein HY701_12715 [Gemmatimonadetes bacterium]|nr:hypothetical protein [Gemmatimonadota bacterium]
MDPETAKVVAQYGIAALALVILFQVLRIFAPLLTRKAAGDLGTVAGEQSADFWRRTNKELFAEELSASVVPILKQQTDILGELRTMNARQTELMLKVQFTLDEVRSTQDRYHTNTHDNVHGLRNAVGEMMTAIALVRAQQPGPGAVAG